jgi:Glycine/sarcosine/betaine reductase selenoprotein B (GRDB)
MAKVVDSFRFLPPSLKEQLSQYIAQVKRPDATPWTPLRRRVSEATVALVSTAGIALKDDTPFDQERERQDPWWGDPTFRVIPPDATAADVRAYHLHINLDYLHADLDCAFPLTRLRRLADTGVVGRSAPRHFSIMGYSTDTTELERESAPRMATLMKHDGVDLAIFVPV